jgi:hypothetical protein
MRELLDLEIYNRFRMGKMIAAELKPSAAQFRKWIGIYQPVPPSVNAAIPACVYSVFVFELEKEKVAAFAGDEDLIICNDKRYYLNAEEELVDLLLDLHVNPKLFTYPWRCDYPF